MYEDDGHYISVSRSLVEGLGFADRYDPLLRPHGMYPPGYPLILAGLYGLGGSNLWVARLFTLGCSLLALVVAGQVLRPCPRFQLALLLTGLNCYWVLTSTFVMSDFPFTLTAWLFVLMFPTAPTTWKRWALQGFLAAVLAYLRTSGISIAAGGLVMMLLRRTRPGPYLAYLGMLALTLLPNLLRPTAYSFYTSIVTSSEGQLDRLSVVSENFSHYVRAVPLWLWGEPSLLTSLARQGPAALALTSLAGLTLLCILRGLPALVRADRRVALAVLLLAVTVPQQLLWPYQDVRFFLAWLPLLYLGALTGAGRGGPALALAMVLSQAGFTAWTIQGAWRHPAPPSPAYSWVASHAAPGDVLAAGRVEAWLYTGHPMIHLDHDMLAKPAFLLRRLYNHQVRWVVVNRMGPPGDLTRAFLDSRPDQFQKEHEVGRVNFNPVNNQEPAVVSVYRVVGDGSKFLQAFNHFENGCAALDKRDPAQAERLFQDCLRLAQDRDFPFARYLLGVSQQQQDHRDQARATFSEVLRLFPGHPLASQALQELSK